MSIGVYKTFSSGEILTAADLNASFTQIVSNGTDVSFPLTKNASLAGFSLFFDSSNTRSITDAAKGLNFVATAINDAKTTVASATTPDIWTSTGRLIDYTGVTTATGFAAAAQAGASRTLLCAGAAPFTAGANMLIDGYASGTTFTAQAGDVVEVIAVTTTQFRLKPRLYTNAPIFADIATNDFRLSLTTGLPVTTADVTGATTVYAVPKTGNRISLFDGTNWNTRISAEFSLALGTLSSGKPYDVFCYDNSGVPTLEFLVWTNDSTRATALAYQNGILVKSGAATRRFLATFYTTSTTATEDSFAKRNLSNYYHQELRPMRVTEATNTWSYALLQIRQARATATNQLEFVSCVAENAVSAQIIASAANDTLGMGASVGIGLDTTSAFTAGCLVGRGTAPAANFPFTMTASLKVIPAAGRHILSWNETGDGTGTLTWYGDGFADTQSGIHGEVWG